MVGKFQRHTAIVHESNICIWSAMAWSHLCKGEVDEKSGKLCNQNDQQGQYYPLALAEILFWERLTWQTLFILIFKHFLKTEM